MDIVVAGVAVVAFAATVYVLAGIGGRTRPRQPRTVLFPDPEEEGWLTVQQVATVLELPPSEVVDLVDRDAIPFYLVRGGRLSEPQYLRFRRDEIEEWTIG
ncbi:MAG: helix-turn-helix domain-containing protein [Solirubrobacterales bacterium]